MTLTKDQLQMIHNAIDMNITSNTRAMNSKQTTSPQFKPIYEKLNADLMALKIQLSQPPFYITDNKK